MSEKKDDKTVGQHIIDEALRLVGELEELVKRPPPWQRFGPGLVGRTRTGLDADVNPAEHVAGATGMSHEIAAEVAKRLAEDARAEEAKLRLWLEETTPGIYQHYKGGFYTVLGVVRHHDHREPMVLYVSAGTGNQQVRELRQSPNWGRKVDAWTDVVEVDYGAYVETKRRFVRVRDLG